VGNFPLIDIAEHQWHYIARLMERLQRGDCSEISVSKEALEKFETERIAAAKTTVWFTGGCRSWYLDAEGIPSSWPWDYQRFVEEMREPDWSAYAMGPPGQ
jgi:hypothetical protein